MPTPAALDIKTWIWGSPMMGLHTFIWLSSTKGGAKVAVGVREGVGVFVLVGVGVGLGVREMVGATVGPEVPITEVEMVPVGVIESVLDHVGDMDEV